MRQKTDQQIKRELDFFLNNSELSTFEIANIIGIEEHEVADILENERD